MCGYPSNLHFSALLTMCFGRVLAAETRDGLQEKGATMETSICVTEPVEDEDKIHARMFTLAVDNASKSRVFCSMILLVPLCECVTSVRHLATAACLRSPPSPYRHP